MATKPIEVLIEAKTTGNAEIDALNKRLDDLSSQQELIANFVKIKQETVSAGAAFEAAQAKAQQLGRELAATDAPTKKQTAEFGRAREAVNSTKEAYQDAQLRLQAMRGALAENNIETTGLAQKQAALRNDVREVEAAVAGATARLKDHGASAASAGAGVEKLATAADKAGGEISDLSKAVDEKTRAIKVGLQVEQSEIELQRQHLAASQAEQQARLQAARAKGDDAAATRASNALRQIESDQLALVARAKRAEATAVQQAADARRQELAAVGPLNAAHAKELQAAENYAKALRVEAAAADQAAQRARELGTATDRAAESANGYKGALTEVASAVAGVFAVGKVVDYARSVNDVADQYKNLEARLRLAVGAEGDLRAAVAGVGQVAKDTHSNLDATSVLYARLAASAKELNITNAEALGITKTINQSIQVSGASAQASEAAVRQLVQGLQSGVLRGDEFNSVMENSPRLAKALADGLGVPIGALRGMAEAGELTSARVVKALKGQADAINQEFSTLPLTTGRALENLNTQWTLFIGNLTGGAQQSSVVAQGINAIANNLDTLAGVATRAGAVLTAALAVQGVQALRAFAVEMVATGKGADLLALSLSKVPKVISITVAAVGFEVGFQIGEMLHENSALARKLGIGVTEFLTQIVNDMRFLAEAAAAVFTSDTVNAAVDRYVQRNKEIHSTFEGMYADAEKAPAKIASAADAGAGSLGKLGGAGTAAGAAVAAGGAQGAAGVGQVAKAADDARLALAGLATAINTKPANKTGIADIVAELTAAKLRGEDLDLQLRQKLPDAISKLSGPELVKFRADFVVAMDGAKKALQDAIDTKKPQAEIDALRAKVDSFERATRTGLGLIAEQAAQNLGIDVPAAFGKMSQGFKESQDNLSILIRQLPELKAVGVDTGAAVGQALSKMLDGAKNQAELDAVIARIQTLRKELGDKIADGLLDQAKEKATALKDALDAATPGINSVREAMKLLGVTSEESLKKTATSFKEAYETMAADGTRSARELSEAFKKAAEAAIAANKGVAPSWVEAEAAANGYRIVIDEAGKATLKLNESTQNVANTTANVAPGMQRQWRGVVGSINDAGQALDDYQRRMQKTYGRPGEGDKNVNDPNRTSTRGEKMGAGVEEIGTGGSQFRNKDGFTSDAMGKAQTMGIWTRTAIIDYLTSAGLDELIAAKLSEQFLDANGNVPYEANDVQKKWAGKFGTLSEALGKMAEYYRFDDAGQLEANALLEFERKRRSSPQLGQSGPVGPSSSSASSGTSSTSQPRTNAAEAANLTARSGGGNGTGGNGGGLSANSGGATYISNITIPGLADREVIRFADPISQARNEDLLRKLAQAKSTAIR